MSDPVSDYRDVAGLRVPIALVGPIIAALRDAYPAITEPVTDDEQAVRVVLREFIGSVLSSYRVKQVAAAGQAQLDQQQAALAAQVSTAYDQAMAAVQAIPDTPAAT